MARTVFAVLACATAVAAFSQLSRQLAQLQNSSDKMFERVAVAPHAVQTRRANHDASERGGSSRALLVCCLAVEHVANGGLRVLEAASHANELALGRVSANGQPPRAECHAHLRALLAPQVVAQSADA